MNLSGGAIVKELYFEAHEDKVDGGYFASAIGYGIHTQAETLEELRPNILDAVDCYFDSPDEAPTIIHLRVVSEETLVR
ncbi:MAG: 2-oxoisovalerate dehydrogenase [Armatimonadetes bacterium]|nr:2-oxoisovalerate dehydrogenase [Armatimonadota bacterium]